jgi:hypothetical protein
MGGSLQGIRERTRALNRAALRRKQATSAYLSSMKCFNLILLVAVFGQAGAQSIEVTYDKTRDMSGYRTFRFGEAEVITPQDMRTIDPGKLKEHVNTIIVRELTGRGLQQVDTSAQLVVSYIIGYLERSGVYTAGPLGGTPGAPTAPGAVMQDYKEGTFVVDLEDRSDNLIWRISSVIRYSNTETLRQVEEVVGKGFKKFPNKLKKKKK